MRVLVADDNENDRLLAIREIRKGYPSAEFIQVDSAAAFEAALEQDGFDVVITDYKMGWLDGLELLRRMKARYPGLPVLMVTGTGGEEIAVEALQEGADDYLVKNQLRFDRLPRAVTAALERAHQRRELAQAERRYGDLFRAVPVGLCRCAPDGLVLEANPTLAILLGRAPEELSGLRLPCLIEEGQEAWNAALSGAAPEIRLQRTDGGVIWAVLRAREVAADGDVVECALTDVTESKHAAEEREALLGELYHRVNNTLQMLIGMVTTQAGRVTDPEVQQMLHDLTGRIHAISLIQQRLYETERFTEIDFGDFLRDLAASVSVAPATSLRLDLSSMTFAVGQAIPLGLAANELLTNCLKHGFPDGRRGEIMIRLAREGDMAVLEIVDSGVGMPSGPERREGYGLRLLNLLMRQARAKMDVISTPGRGTRTTIRFLPGDKS
jgi:PAS domain S-box-containing protein